MKYLPCICTVLFGCVAVTSGLYITETAHCLWALFIVFIATVSLYPD